MTTPIQQPPFGQPAPGGWGHMPPVAPPAKKPSRRKTWFTHSAVALVALGMGAGMGGGADAGDGEAATPAPTVTVTAAAKGAAPTKTAAKPTTPTAKPTDTTAASAAKISGDGEYLVGQDMKPGTYKTKGPTDGSMCYWERAKDSSGDFDSIITNGTPTGTGRVTVKKGEVFKTQGCQDWTKVG
ncbi:hypothetical protein [Streptomyces sp. NBC_01235]|uniref:hypothetical protein n=1 Tax=Streptomyces sp. NBC_01235 TaxID=2903788 RepID=UPI002E0F4817|nr:hypothetical protein OG289_22090 [Streptomyces sp. NBC_01235]